MNKLLTEVPASVTVIDRQMIRSSGAREIADIFRMVPGFVVGYKYGGTPVVTYHGLGLEFHRQLQVLVDGRSVFIPSFGGVPWSNLPLLLEDIERVEVTRGPNAVTYGASAFLATINIITRHAAEDLGGKVIVTHDLDNDSNAQDVYVRYGNNYGDLDWRLSAGREKDDGYSTEFDSKVLEKLNLRTDFFTTYNQFWTISAGINQSSIGRGDGTGTNPTREEDGSNSYQNIKWELQNTDAYTTIKLTHTKQDINDDFLAVVPLLPISADVSFSQLSNRLDLEIFQNRFLKPNLTWNYGLSSRRDEVKSFWLFNDDKTYEVKTNNLFSSVEWKLPSSTILDAGFLIEDSNITEQEESYRLSIIQQIQNHHLRVVTSSAKRNPLIWEQIGNISFDATIDPTAPPPFDVLAGQTVPFEIVWLNADNVIPESIISNEIGMLSQYFERQLTTDIKLFQYKITDQMTEEKVSHNLTPLNSGDPDYYQIINGGSTKVNGIELYFNYSPKHTNFRLFGGLSFTDTKSFEKDFKKSVPDKTGFLGGHYNFNPQHQLSAAFYRVDELSWADSNNEGDAYNKLDIRYEYTLGRKNQLKLELIGYNLADEYEEYLHDNIQQQSYLLRISGRF